MKAPVGSVVKLYVDLAARVKIGDVIETDTGRRYRVIAARVQERGKHTGRQHLMCLVLDGEPPQMNATTDEDGNLVVPKVHRIRWYSRGRGKR